MPSAKTRTPGLRRRPKLSGDAYVDAVLHDAAHHAVINREDAAALRVAPPPPSRQTHPLPPLFDSPARAVIDAFFAFVDTGVRRDGAAMGLALVYRGDRAALVCADGVRVTHDDGGDDTLESLVIAHVDEGVVYRDHTGYGGKEPHVQAHVMLFEALFARWLRQTGA